MLGFCYVIGFLLLITLTLGMFLGCLLLMGLFTGEPLYGLFGLLLIIMLFVFIGLGQSQNDDYKWIEEYDVYPKSYEGVGSSGHISSTMFMFVLNDGSVLTVSSSQCKVNYGDEIRVVKYKKVSQSNKYKYALLAGWAHGSHSDIKYNIVLAED